MTKLPHLRIALLEQCAQALSRAVIRSYSAAGPEGSELQPATIATCESLTAGLLAATMANTPGASAVLRGGLVTYQTDTKHSLAGVPEQLLAQDGPVAATTAAAMAKGTAQRVAADVAVSLTGVAGPDPQDGNPVGTIFLGCYAAGQLSPRAEAVLSGGHRLPGQVSEAVPFAQLTEVWRDLNAAGSSAGYQAAPNNWAVPLSAELVRQWLVELLEAPDLVNWGEDLATDRETTGEALPDPQLSANRGAAESLRPIYPQRTLASKLEETFAVPLAEWSREELRQYAVVGALALLLRIRPRTR